MKETTSSTDKISKIIIKNATEELTNTLKVLDLEFEDLSYFIDDLTNDEKDKTIAITINKLLEKLKQNLTIDIYRKIARDVDEMTDFYDSKKDGFDSIIEEGDQIANDLLFKVIGYKGQQFDLPIDISCIKKYCLSAEIKKEQVYDVLMWIIIRYIAIDTRISWQEYLDNLNENRQIKSSSKLSSN